MSSAIRISLVACACLAAAACASGEDIESGTGSGPTSSGAAGRGGSGGGTPGSGGTGGSTATTGAGGVGGTTGSGGASGTTGTGTGGGVPTGGASGSGGSPTGGSGGAAGGIRDAADDRPAPIDAGTCTSCQLRVQYRAADTNASDNQIKPHFNIVNVGTTSVALRELTIRYWYTADGDRPQVYWCDYAVLGCANVTGKFVKLSTPEQGADSYLEIGFADGAGTLAANGQTGEIQNRFNKDNYSNYNEADDYSFDPAKTSFTDWIRVTLYHNGGLVWGIDPSCANPRDGAVCGDAGNVADGGANPDTVGGEGGTSDIAMPDIAVDARSDDATVDGSADASDGNSPDI